MKRLLILSVLFITLFGSCRYFTGKRIRGNGNIKTESRTTGSFNSVDVSGAIDLYVSQDSVASVKVEADENLMQFIEITTDGSVLNIHPRRGTNLRPTKGIKVHVANPAYSQFEATGACNIYGENKINSPSPVSISLSGASDVKMELTSPEVKADLSGAGTIALKGETKDFRVEGSGSTKIRCFELMAETTYVRLSGAGDAEVFASVKLEVKVSGAADVLYKGNPSVSQSTSGAASVKKVE